MDIGVVAQVALGGSLFAMIVVFTASSSLSTKISGQSSVQEASDSAKTEDKSPDAIKERFFDMVRKDLAATRQEYFIPAPRFLSNLFVPHLAEEELPLFYTIFNVVLACVLQIAVIYLYNPRWQYIALMTTVRLALIGLPRFVLATHFASHVPIFKPEWVNTLVLHYLLCPIMGIPPGTYHFHHIVMHHKENNIHPIDLSSTMPYQRDNFLHFLFYWVRFEFGIWFEFAYWMMFKGYYSMIVQLAFSASLWFGLIGGTWHFVRPAVALWMFAVPQFITSFLLMFGNWSQHLFVDFENFDDDHALTVNLVDSFYNQVTFNDGYHIIHHKYPKLVWTQLPVRMMDDREFLRHSKANAITLRDIDWFWMGVFAMTGNLKKMAEHMVPMNEEQAAMSLDERVAFMRIRLIPIPGRRKDYLGLFAVFNLLFGM